MQQWQHPPSPHSLLSYNTHAAFITFVTSWVRPRRLFDSQFLVDGNFDDNNMIAVQRSIRIALI